jgi:uncharacterized protein GlcG (DUF336 family)
MVNAAPVAIANDRRTRHKRINQIAPGENVMAKLTLDQASKIIEAASAKAKAQKMNPLTIAVLDDGGHLKAFVRPDGPGGPLRPHIAIGKAWGAVAFGMSSRMLESRFNARPHFLNALVNVSSSVGGGLIPVPGGVIICAPDGEILGAVGASGDTSDNDELAAVAGIEAAGLKADAGQQN